jgi:hypothetical protein
MYQLLSRLAAIGNLVGWGLTLPRLAGLGGQAPGPSEFAIVAGTGLATVLTLAGQSRQWKPSSLLLWLSGGIWAGGAYISEDVVGLVYFLVAALRVVGAAAREREHGSFSLSGPAAFITAMLAMILAYHALPG